MSFFGSLVNAVLAGFEGQPGITGAVARELLQHLQQNDGGGLNSLVEQLGQKGLREVVQSWVGTGANKDVTADQLGHALDPKLLEQLAAKLGISPQAVTAELANVLPKIVDRLTPNGKLPAGLPEPLAESAAE